VFPSAQSLLQLGGILIFTVPTRLQSIDFLAVLPVFVLSHPQQQKRFTRRDSGPQRRSHGVPNRVPPSESQARGRDHERR
jgi:hypothetical protein